MLSCTKPGGYELVKVFGFKYKLEETLMLIKQ